MENQKQKIATLNNIDQDNWFQLFESRFNQNNVLKVNTDYKFRAIFLESIYFFDTSLLSVWDNSSVLEDSAIKNNIGFVLNDFNDKVFYGSINVEIDKDNVIDLGNSKSDFSFTETTLTYDYFLQKLKNTTKTVTTSSKKFANSYSLDRLNNLDKENGGLSDEDFMKRLEILLNLGKHKQKKVFGEYDVVNQFVKNPVLMNKAISIPLSFDETIELIDDLTLKYENELIKVKGFGKYFLKNKQVPIRFSESYGAHADPTNAEIKLCEFGDWRMSKYKVWCAETIFHEFVHCLGFNTTSYSNMDAHTEFFVVRLEEVLEDYRDWIEERFDYEYHCSQIIDNTANYILWKSSNDDLKKKELKKQDQEQKDTAKLYKNYLQEQGYGDDEFPIDVILLKYQDEMIDYLIFGMTEYKKSVSQKFEVNQIIKTLKNDREYSTFSKKQITMILESLNKRYREYFADKDIMLDSILNSEIDNFIPKLESLSRGIISQNIDLNKRKIRKGDRPK